MRLLVTDGLPIAGGLVRPDDVLRVESEGLEITPSRSRPEHSMVKVRSETRNQRGEVVQILVAMLVVTAPVKDNMSWRSISRGGIVSAGGACRAPIVTPGKASR
jgi:hypothetical protein